MVDFLKGMFEKSTVLAAQRERGCRSRSSQNSILNTHDPGSGSGSANCKQVLHFACQGHMGFVVI
jgi:hypothetical protein